MSIHTYSTNTKLSYCYYHLQTNKSISDRLPSNGVGVNAPSQTEVSSEQPQLTNTTTQTTTTTSNSHDHLNDGGHNRVAATGQDNTDLSDNFE